MRLLIAAAAAAALLAPAGAAHAHAHLRSASPPVDGTVPTAPPELAITYSEGVEPRFSAIEVRDAAGARVDKDDAHTAPGDNKVLVVGLRALPPGTYTVTWRATAVDTRKTDGSFRFTVEP